MELRAIDETDYTNSLNDNDLSLIMCNHILSSTKLDEETLSAPVDEDSVTEYLRILFDEEDDSLLVDLDPEWNEKVPNIVGNLDDKPQANKSLFDDDEDDDDIDLDSWLYKPIENWEKSDTINWLLWAGVELGHSYSRMSPELAISGKKLLSLFKEDFHSFDQQFGKKLYDLLHQKRDVTSYRPSCYSSKTIHDDENLTGSGDDSSGEESANCPDTIRQEELRNMKRPRLWKFVRHLLLNPEFCPEWIRWEDYGRRTFRFVQNESVAKFWGKLNNRPNMTYKKFSRAIRHYYKNPHNPIFVPVKQRLVYQFGDTVKGLETDDPNFQREYSKSRLRSRLYQETTKFNVKSPKGSKCKERRPGRPRNPNKKVKNHRLVLWEFLRDKLHDRRYCPAWIRWEKYEEKSFRFVQGPKMAKLWGERDNTKEKKMTYENLTRAMRYWYKQGMFDSVRRRKRHVYKFVFKNLFRSNK